MQALFRSYLFFLDFFDQVMHFCESHWAMFTNTYFKPLWTFLYLKHTTSLRKRMAKIITLKLFVKLKTSQPTIDFRTIIVIYKIIFNISNVFFSSHTCLTTQLNLSKKQEIKQMPKNTHTQVNKAKKPLGFMPFVISLGTGFM